MSSRNLLNETHFALNHSAGKPFLAVHLEDVKLPNSFVLQTGRIQAIVKHRMDEERYCAQLGRCISADLRQSSVGIGSGASNQAIGQRGAASPQVTVVQVPSFHYGGVVPPDYFIGREEELDEASRLIRAGQGLLLVGNRRAGKTSFCTKLIHEIMGRADNDVLAAYLNLQLCLELTLETFLEHTLLNVIGEMARQVFHCKYSDLLAPNPSETSARLREDASSHPSARSSRPPSRRPSSCSGSTRTACLTPFNYSRARAFAWLTTSDATSSWLNTSNKLTQRCGKRSRSCSRGVLPHK